MERINPPRIVTLAIRFNVEMSDFSRRDFIKITTTTLLTISGLLGLDALFRFLDYQTEPPAKTEFDLGPASNYPIGSRSFVPDVPAFLIHDQNGFSALSLVCTHLGCTVEQKDNGFACPCHGSLYDASGNVLRGPAQKSLRVLRVEVSANGNLILHTD
ncbi:MAG: ubiquinol-cytochrome c reductase iron-sulfur subunit [Chloroflexi bacterium]|nr:ubiquinol-cytochrome c reductase iron-sulfur subunit [Chloroflexota bacterium]